MRIPFLKAAATATALLYAAPALPGQGANIIHESEDGTASAVRIIDERGWTEGELYINCSRQLLSIMVLDDRKTIGMDNANVFYTANNGVEEAYTLTTSGLRLQGGKLQDLVHEMNLSADSLCQRKLNGRDVLNELQRILDRAAEPPKPRM